MTPPPFKLGDFYAVVGAAHLPVCDAVTWTTGGATIGCARPQHEDPQHIYVENNQVREIWSDPVSDYKVGDVFEPNIVTAFCPAAGQHSETGVIYKCSRQLNHSGDHLAAEMQARTDRRGDDAWVVVHMWRQDVTA